MMDAVELTKRESEIAELFAWGASKKDIANRLFISERTVENHARTIYKKTGCGKVNELSAWWFCTTFHISFDLSPFRRKIISLCFLVLMIPQTLRSDNAVVRVRNTPCRESRISRRRMDEEATDFEL